MCGNDCSGASFEVAVFATDFDYDAPVFDAGAFDPGLGGAAPH